MTLIACPVAAHGQVEDNRCQVPMDVRLQIPDDVAQIIQSKQPDLSQAALEALAIEEYRNRRLSESQVRRLLGLRTRLQVHAFLKAHNVYLNYSVQELEDDLQSLKHFEETLAI